MKKMIAAFLLIFLGLAANASEIASNAPAVSETTSTNSPQVCQFSLTSYSGTIFQEKTGKFKVGLSCPQQTNVRATVIVKIDNELVASTVVTIEAGKVYSDDAYISVGPGYEGKKYSLGVQ
ncbi:MAG: hypothetical protein HDS07_01390 [Bacteroides sp.]|nr:hypothetical protein [Bacteroides sp.]